MAKNRPASEPYPTQKRPEADPKATKCRRLVTCIKWARTRKLVVTHRLRSSGSARSVATTCIPTGCCAACAALRPVTSEGSCAADSCRWRATLVQFLRRSGSCHSLSRGFVDDHLILTRVSSKRSSTRRPQNAPSKQTPAMCASPLRSGCPNYWTDWARSINPVTSLNLPSIAGFSPTARALKYSRPQSILALSVLCRSRSSKLLFGLDDEVQPVTGRRGHQGSPVRVVASQRSRHLEPIGQIGVHLDRRVFLQLIGKLPLTVGVVQDVLVHGLLGIEQRAVQIPAAFTHAWMLLALQPNSRASSLMPRPARTNSTIC